VECLGRKMKLVPDSLDAVLYPYDADLNDVCNSVRIVIQSLELESRVRRRRESNDEHKC
jgi:hypothetical protein